MKRKVADHRNGKQTGLKNHALKKRPLKSQCLVKASSAHKSGAAASVPNSMKIVPAPVPARRISVLNYFALAMACASGLALWAPALLNKPTAHLIPNVP
jgi:hypothetical protein